MERQSDALIILWSIAQWHARFGKCACWGILASALITLSVAQDHPLGLQLSTPCGTVGVGVTERDDLRSHHRRFGFLVGHPPHAVHLALRLSDEQVASTAIDEVRG